MPNGLRTTLRKPARGSEMSWSGYPPESRVCPVCGRRVTLNDSFRAHTEGGVKTVAHVDCLRAGRA